MVILIWIIIDHLEKTVHVRLDIPCLRKPELESKIMESLSIKVSLGKTKCLIACLYKIQYIKDLDFENIMSDILENIILDYDKYIIMGDVNVDS